MICKMKERGGFDIGGKYVQMRAKINKTDLLVNAPEKKEFGTVLSIDTQWFRTATLVRVFLFLPILYLIDCLLKNYLRKQQNFYQK